MIYFQITYCKFGKKFFWVGATHLVTSAFCCCSTFYFSSSALVLSWKIRFLLIFFISMFFSTSFALTFINNLDLIRPEKCALSYPDYLKKITRNIFLLKKCLHFSFKKTSVKIPYPRTNHMWFETSHLSRSHMFLRQTPSCTVIKYYHLQIAVILAFCEPPWKITFFIVS